MKNAPSITHPSKITKVAIMTGWVTATTMLLAGCGTLPEPWQKGTLARIEMKGGSHILPLMATRAHIQTSREAATGGFDGPAPGCGCN